VRIGIGGREQQDWVQALQKGFAVAGDESEISKQYNRNRQVHVCWGTKKRLWKECQRYNGHTLIIERAFLGDRLNEWFMLGKDGLNNLANFNNENVPVDRWEKYWKAGMRPWRGSVGDYALIMGQIPGDASLGGMCPYRWAEKVAQELKTKYKKVLFRPHPGVGTSRKVFGTELTFENFNDEVDGAAVVVTYSSNAGVLSVMRGAPTVAYYKGSMVYDIVSHDVKDDLIFPDREDWGRKISYAQWTLEEIESGKAWLHLRELFLVTRPRACITV
jgi:hypothetical protein